MTSGCSIALSTRLRLTIGAFLPLLFAKSSSSLHPGAGSSRRNYRPLGNHAVTVDLTGANALDHSLAFADQAWLRSPVASKESSPSTRRVTRQGRSPALAPRSLAHSTNCEI